MLVLLLACSTEPERVQRPEPDDRPAPFSVTGAAPAIDLSLAPGQVVPLVFGGQGGFHVDVSGRVRGLGALVALELSVDVDDLRIASQGDLPTYLRLVEVPGTDEALFEAERAFILDNSLVSVCGWRGRTATVCAHAASLEDPSLDAGGCVDVVLQMDPANDYMCG